MIILSKTEKNEHTILSASICLNTLVRIDLDTYAVFQPLENEPILKFKSVSFSRLLNRMTDAIVKIDIYNANNDAPLIHLHLQNGQIAAFDSNEASYTMTHLEKLDLYKDDDLRPVLTYYENLPPTYPFNRMLMESDLIEQINLSASHSNPSHTLQHLWSVYRHTLANGINYHGDHPQVIASELGNFVIREYPCGRVAFTAT